MELIKIQQDHYIIVDDSEIKEGDFVYDSKDKVIRFVKQYLKDDWIKKITHSTQPLEFENVKVFDKEWKEGYFDKIQPLNLSEVKELIGEVDVEKKSYDILKGFVITKDERRYFELGYTKALEDNKNRKYTEEDMRKAIEMAREEHCYADDLNGYYWSKVEIIKSLQPKTEWEVEFVDGKLALKK